MEMTILDILVIRTIRLTTYVVQVIQIEWDSHPYDTLLTEIN